MKSNRNVGIDMMKGWLVILMTISHLSYVTSYHANCVYVHRFNIYVNLTTFSGFMFCFGYVCWLAYIDTDTDTEDIYKRLLKGANKSLLAFWISGISFVLFYGGTWKDLLSVLLLQKMPSLSEFLLSFALIYLLLFLFRKHLKKMNWVSMFILSVVSLMIIKYFPLDIIVSPVMGSIIGTTSYSCFPIIGYVPYFMLGGFFAKYEDRCLRLIVIASAVLMLLFWWEFYATGSFPERFPPKPLWIIGGMLPVCVYYFIFTCLDGKGIQIKPLSFWGKRTLVLLVSGNVVSFALRGSTKDGIQKRMGSLSDIPMFLLLIFFVFVLAYVISVTIRVSGTVIKNTVDLDR